MRVLKHLIFAAAIAVGLAVLADAQGVTRVPSQFGASTFTGTITPTTSGGAAIGTPTLPWSTGTFLTSLGINIGTAQTASFEIGDGGSQATPEQIFINRRGTTARPQIVFNWAGGGAWAIGPASATGDDTVQIGNVTGANADWSSATQVTILKVGDGYTIGAAGGSYRLAAKAFINTAPTSPVACTSPTVTNSNGSAAFQVDVGTSCTGVSTLVVTMPTATNAWAGCTATHVQSFATRVVAMTASTTTSVTFTNYSRTLGTAADWTDADDVRIGGCVGG